LVRAKPNPFLKIGLERTTPLFLRRFFFGFAEPVSLKAFNWFGTAEPFLKRGFGLGKA
jgi:hypothetical protein